MLQPSPIVDWVRCFGCPRSVRLHFVWPILNSQIALFIYSVVSRSCHNYSLLEFKFPEFFGSTVILGNSLTYSRTKRNTGKLFDMFMLLPLFMLCCEQSAEGNILNCVILEVSDTTVYIYNEFSN